MILCFYDFVGLGFMLCMLGFDVWYSVYLLYLLGGKHLLGLLLYCRCSGIARWVI